MQPGDIVFLPITNGYVKYIIKSIIDDTLIVTTPKSKQHNWINVSDVIPLEQIIYDYSNKIIYE